jgi:tetratricopeptide (TPR) repeat protein
LPIKCTKILFLIALPGVLLSCKAKKKGDFIINTGLRDIHLPNREAENDFNKGLYYVRREDYSTAKDFFERADEESPNTPVILNAIGNCLDRTGDPLKGFTYYKKALSIDSSFIRTYVNYGCSLNNVRRYDQAEKVFRLGLNRRPSSSIEKSSLYLNLSYTYYHRGDIETALSLLDSAKMGLTSGRLYDGIIQAEKQMKQGPPMH